MRPTSNRRSGATTSWTEAFSTTFPSNQAIAATLRDPEHPVRSIGGWLPSCPILRSCLPMPAPGKRSAHDPMCSRSYPPAWWASARPGSRPPHRRDPRTNSAVEGRIGHTHGVADDDLEIAGWGLLDRFWATYTAAHKAVLARTLFSNSEFPVELG